MDLIADRFRSAVNHLLSQARWARERLAPFAGETIAIDAAPLPPLRLASGLDGLLVASAPEAEPSLTLTVRPGAAAALARGVDHALREVDVAGNARLATEALFLARHLRWDAEEDLSRIFGDALAHRMVGDARRLAQGLAEAGRRVTGTLLDYAVEERRLAVRRDEHDALARDNARLRDALERLEKRLERLS